MYSPNVKGGAPKQKPRTLFEKVRLEVVLDDSKIQVLSLNIIEDEDAFIPYYDRTTSSIENILANRQYTGCTVNFKTILVTRYTRRFITPKKNGRSYQIPKKPSSMKTLSIEFKNCAKTADETPPWAEGVCFRDCFTVPIVNPRFTSALPKA